MSFQGNQYGGYKAYPHRPPMNPPIHGRPVIHGPPVVVIDNHHHGHHHHHHHAVVGPIMLEAKKDGQVCHDDVT
nr:unnamed protein product [Haemonchus contortus]